MAKLNFNDNPIDFGFGDEKPVVVTEYKENAVVKIPLDLIDIGENIRREENPDELEELAQTIREYGQLEPCVVYKNGDRYTLKLGSRRYSACLFAGIETLDCIVTDPFESESQRMILQAVENEHRKNMTTTEREIYICQLVESGMKPAEVSKALKKSPGWISEAIKAHEVREEMKSTLEKLGGLKEEPTSRVMYEMRDLSKAQREAVFRQAKAIDGGTNRSIRDALKAYLGDETEPAGEKKAKTVSGTKKKADDGTVSLNGKILVDDAEKSVSFTLKSSDDELSVFLKSKIKDFYKKKGYSFTI